MPLWRSIAKQNKYRIRQSRSPAARSSKFASDFCKDFWFFLHARPTLGDPHTSPQKYEPPSANHEIWWDFGR